MRQKYNAKKTVIDGITFDSKAEATYYVYLKHLQEKGDIIDIELQPVYVLQPAYWKCCKSIDLNTTSKHTCSLCGKKIPKTSAITYRADFKVTYADGNIEIIDVKGMETAIFKIKKKMFEKVYPEHTIKIVKGGKTV
jgi:hypothetical protein